MMKRTLTAFIAAMLIPLLPLSACKKQETPHATTPPPAAPEQAHQQAMLQKSFEESKKATAATVNGEPIMEFWVLREMNTIAPQYLAEGKKPTPELNAKIRKNALNTLIIQELAVQAAKKRGMKAGPELIDNEIKKMKASMGSDDAYKAYLTRNGFTENDLRTMIERDYLFELIASHEIDAKITVSDAVLKDRYNKEKKNLVAGDASHRQLSFEEAKGQLEKMIRAEAGEKRMRDWEKELRKNARIEIAKKK